MTLAEETNKSYERRKRLTFKVTEAANSAKKLNRQSSSSLAQLRLADFRLHGREDDLKLLKSRLRDLVKGHEGGASKRQLLLISGMSGTGKSALVMRGIRDPAQKMGIAFAGGKFDQSKAALPFSAIMDALSSLTNHVMAQTNAEEIRDGINEALGVEEETVIANAMTGCCQDIFSSRTPRRTVGNRGQGRLSAIGRSSAIGRRRLSGIGRMSASERRRSSFSVGEGGKDSSYRLQYAIRKLLEVICSNLKGVILFIDDVQWGDVATLDLLKSLALDQKMSSLMLVANYRNDGVPKPHPLALQLCEATHLGLDIVTIKVGNLSSSTAKSLIADALKMEDYEDEVEPLATIIFKKTEGNAFFVLTFLRSLLDEELIKYNFGVMKWLWDIDVIKKKLITQNVANVMLEKLQRLDEMSQILMKIASCLGATFSLSIMATIFKSITRSDTKLDLSDTARGLCDEGTNAFALVSNSMRYFKKEGLWESDGEDSCRFSHDQIQLAAFRLISSEQRDPFRGMIGDILMNKLDPVAFEEALYQVVSLKNCDVAHISQDERRCLAKINLRAGLKAFCNAAFDTAEIYFKEARGLFGQKAWEQDYESMLKLCSIEAHARFITGDIETMQVLIEEVLSKDIPIEDKFVAFEVKILAAQAGNRFDEAISMSLKVRKELGLRAPANKRSSKIILLKEYLKTKRMVNGRTAEEIAELPELTDERIIMGQRMLEFLMVCTFQAQPTLHPIIIFMGVQASIKHGINDSSICLFNSYGSILCRNFGQLKEGHKMANAVELILEKPEMKHKKSRGMYGMGVVKGWGSPLQASLRHLLEGYHQGLEVGDVEAAGLNLYSRGVVLWFSGRPLKAVELELETSVSVLAEINQVGQRLIVLTCLIAARQLSGNCTPLRGSLYQNDEEMELEDLSEIALDIGNNAVLGHIALVKLELLVLYHDWEAAKNLLMKSRDLRLYYFPMFCHAVRYTFLRGLICLKTAQSATSWLDKRKWKRRAQKSMKLMRTWLKKGNVNVVHSMHLLNAEHAVLKANKTDAKEMFKAAATVAATNGFLQDKALAHELAGLYFEEQGDEYWAKFNLERAHQSNLDWQAYAKNKDFAERRESLLERNEQKNNALAGIVNKGNFFEAHEEVDATS